MRFARLTRHVFSHIDVNSSCVCVCVCVCVMPTAARRPRNSIRNQFAGVDVGWPSVSSSRQSHLHAALPHNNTVLCASQCRRRSIADTSRIPSFFVWLSAGRVRFNRCANVRAPLFMVALCNRADHYIFILFLLLSSSFFFLFFLRLISAVGNWMFTILLWHMMWP